MEAALVITLIETAIKLAPAVVGEVQLLLAKGNPTPEDWEALRQKVSKPYDAYIQEAKDGQAP